MINQVQNGITANRLTVRSINKNNVTNSIHASNNLNTNLALFDNMSAIKSQTIAFTGIFPKSGWIKIASGAHNTFSKLLSEGQKLTEKEHGQLIIKLQEQLGSKPVILEDVVNGTKMAFDSGLVKTNASGKVIGANIEELNKPGVLNNLVNALKAMIEATEYGKQVKYIQHIGSDGKIKKIAVNNSEIHQLLKGRMTSDKFDILFKKVEEKGVFKLKFDAGVPSVSDAAGTLEMTRKWPRDHAGMWALIDAKYPEQVLPGLKTVAQTYCSPEEVAAFERVIKNPEIYKENGGIAHVFFFDSKAGKLVRDPGWGNNQRIESHSETLGAFVRKIKDGLTGKDPAGYKSVEDIPDEVIKATVNFTHYLEALGPNAQTAGPWEEVPFAKGANWDTTSCTQAFKKVKELVQFIYAPENANNSEIRALRERFANVEEELMKRTGRPECKALFSSNTSNIDKYINNGENTVRENYLNEFRGVTDRIDASSVMITASDIDLSSNGNLVEDVERHLAVLDRFENNLVGEFGARRYNQFQMKLQGVPIDTCDSYLNKSYDIAVHPETDGIHLGKAKINEEFFGAKDASDPNIFMARARGVKEATSAQWALPTSYAAIGYGKQVEKLVMKYEKKGNLTDQEFKLLKRAFNGQTEHIKRTYGNITGVLSNGNFPTKANGQSALVWRKPEAYQAVPTLIPANPKNIGDSFKRSAFIPGVNSHLGWDASKTYEASVLYKQNLQNLEKLDLLNKLS